MVMMWRIVFYIYNGLKRCAKKPAMPGTWLGRRFQVHFWAAALGRRAVERILTQYRLTYTLAATNIQPLASSIYIYIYGYHSYGI